MDSTITIERLLALCSHGTHINIKLADTAIIAINGVNSLENSKHKRQKAKWEAFRERPVFHISPAVEIADIKRNNGSCFRMIIEAYILRSEYDSAMNEMERIMACD